MEDSDLMSHVIKIVIILLFVFIFDVFASSNKVAELKAREYCFKKESSFLELREIKEEYYLKENEIHLSDEYKSCEWGLKKISAKVRLNKNLVLESSYYDTSFDDISYDPIYIRNVSRFSCYLSNGVSSVKNCIEENEKYNVETCTGNNISNMKMCAESSITENDRYNNTILPILKKTIRKKFITDIEIEVQCPIDANDKDYRKKKIMKINRPIIVIGECHK
jgi:hypothetical protein